VQVQLSSSHEAKRTSVKRLKRPKIDFENQDRLLREVVQILEAEQRAKQWTWSWLADQSELTSSAYYAWRKGLTKGHFLRRINSVLHPLGYRLYIGKLPK
jgi:hypothetical protein